MTSIASENQKCKSEANQAQAQAARNAHSGEEPRCTEPVNRFKCSRLQESWFAPENNCCEVGQSRGSAITLKGSGKTLLVLE